MIVDAVMMYFHPETLQNLIPKLKKVCSRYLIVCEQESKPAFYNGKWIHDYEHHFRSNGMTSLSKFKIKDWGGDWDEYGIILFCQNNCVNYALSKHLIEKLRMAR